MASRGRKYKELSSYKGRDDKQIKQGELYEMQG
jgi:hypothetical protein